jgi:hypothetical protein
MRAQRPSQVRLAAARDVSTSRRLASRVSAGLAQLLFCAFDEDSRRPVVDDARNHPSNSPIVDRFADSGRRSICSGVLEVALREPDHKRIWCDVGPPVSRGVRMPLLPGCKTRCRIDAGTHEANVRKRVPLIERLQTHGVTC